MTAPIQPTAQAKPLPVLKHPPFSGSCRIQPLEVTASRWFKVVDVPLDRPLASAVVVLESLSAIPRLTIEMPLSELTRPYRLVHAVLDAKLPAFRPLAALALLETSMPIRVVMDEDGQPTRPEGLLELRGLAPGGDDQALRIRMDWAAENWRTHIEKHLMSEEDLALWQPIVDRQRLPIRLHQLKTAVRLARRAQDGPRELVGLKPEYWPLVEAYAAATVAAFAAMLDGPSIHVGRLLGAPGAVHREIDGLLRLLGDPIGLAPGAEQLVAVAQDRLFTVARDRRGLHHALLWRSTYPIDQAGGAGDKLARLRAFAARTAEFDLVSWP